MTLIAHTEHLFPRTRSVDIKDRKESDGLLVVTMWSVVSVVLAALDDLAWFGRADRAHYGLG
jgi:hypothetical protein